MFNGSVLLNLSTSALRLILQLILYLLLAIQDIANMSPPAKTFTGWVAHDATNPLIYTTFEPKPFTETDIENKVSYCGICGTDIHTLRLG